MATPTRKTAQKKNNAPSKTAATKPAAPATNPAVVNKTNKAKKKTPQIPAAKAAAIVSAVTKAAEAIEAAGTPPAPTDTNHRAGIREAKSKLTKEMDVPACLDRMITGAGLKSLADLADFLGISSQALGNSKTRKSISLPALMYYRDKTGDSLDYLVYGIKQKYKSLKPLISKKGHTTSPIGLTDWWVAQTLRIPATNLCYHVDIDGSILLVDTNDTAKKITDGTYVLEVAGSVSVRTFKLKVDGSATIVGEKDGISKETLAQLTVLGRLVWKGSSI